MGVKTQNRALGMWRTHQKDYDDVFNDPLCDLLHKLLSSKQIFAELPCVFKTKIIFKSYCYRSNTWSLKIQMIQKGLN